MIGTTLSRYRITAKLGEGGMGTVWLAEDALLGRAVALKLLAPHLAASDDARQRFIREARSASKLEHPGIAAVHDAGEAGGQVFIAYQFIEGVTLAARLAEGPLALPELLRLARGTAEALAHAHGRDVLHRDLAAGNIMLRPDGSPVIVDFGLARSHGDVTLTRTGTTLGTAPYLAPEQWRGEAGDARSDLWSLGVVLYFAATGQQPFGVDAPEAVMYRVMNDEPVKLTKLRPELPAEFERLVLRLLEKDPRDRLASASKLAVGLARIANDSEGPAHASVTGESLAARAQRWWRKQARKKFGPVQVAMVTAIVLALGGMGLFVRAQLERSREKVLAVLPMRVAGGDATESVVVAEALGEELVMRFRSAQNFRVLPWATSGRPVPPGLSLTQLGKSIHADLLLTGTVQATDDGITVRAEVVDTRRGEQVWSQQFKRPAGDLIGMQSAIVNDASLHLLPALSKEAKSRLAASLPTNPEAYEYFIRGSNYWHSGDPASLPIAEQYFLRATELDSTLAGAWVALGALRTDRYFRGDRGGQADLNEAENMFRRALRLQPGLPAAERGIIRVLEEGGTPERYSQTLDIAAQALKRDQNDVDQLTTAGVGLFLGCMGELAVPVLEHALKLDPNNQGVAWHRVVALAWGGYPSRCISAGADYTRRYGEDLEIYTWMGACEYELGRNREAFLLLNQALNMNSGSLSHYAGLYLALVARFTGDVAVSERILKVGLPELESRVSAAPDNGRLLSNLAEAYLLLGDTTAYRKAQTRARTTPGVAALGTRMATLSLAGLVEEARRVASERKPPFEQHWFNLVDSVGAESRRLPPNIAICLKSSEYLRTQASIDSTHVLAFNHYRDIVAHALPHEPDVPKPRTKWPAIPPFK